MKTNVNQKPSPRSIYYPSGTDMTNKKCHICNIGTFKEMYQLADADGILNCNYCNFPVNRYKI